MLINAIDWCCDNRKPILVEAPKSLEISCFIKENKYLVHLMNYTTSCLNLSRLHGGAMAEEVIPCSNINRIIENFYRINIKFIQIANKPSFGTGYIG